MTAFEEFIEDQVGKIRTISSSRGKVRELIKETEEKEGALKEELTPAQNTLISEILENMIEIGILRELECYRQGFMDAVLGMGKKLFQECL